VTHSPVISLIAGGVWVVVWLGVFGGWGVCFLGCWGGLEEVMVPFYPRSHGESAQRNFYVL